MTWAVTADWACRGQSHLFVNAHTISGCLNRFTAMAACRHRRCRAFDRRASGRGDRRQDHDRTGSQRVALWPERLVAHTGYGSAEMLNWLVHERGIEPHIPVFDKSKRKDDTVSRSDFAYDRHTDVYICPAGKSLRQRQKT